MAQINCLKLAQPQMANTCKLVRMCVCVCFAGGIFCLLVKVCYTFNIFISKLIRVFNNILEFTKIYKVRRENRFFVFICC